MTTQEAQQIKISDVVVYQGKPVRVTAIKVGLIHGPHFRLEGVEDGLTSHELVQVHDPE